MEGTVKGLKILVVDDDVHQQELAEKIFSNLGALVLSAQNGLEGLRKFYNEKPDLVVLDVMMPEVDGYETCSRIRQVSGVPIILLTALNSDEEIVRGLDAGADDFVTKPVKSEVLIARTKAVLRRVDSSQDTKPRLFYSDNYLTVDMEKRLVAVKGETVQLTRTEYNLLAYLVKNAGWVRTFEQILDNVWGYEYQGSLEYVHVYISHIRKKIEKDPKKPAYIETEHGVGYRFNKLTS
jgi:two-component system KDP operon response regulator KdpE